MLAEFSFLRHPIEKVMRFGHYLVPGVGRIDAIFYDDSSKLLVAKSLTKDMEEYPYGKLMDINSVRTAIDKLRRKRSSFEWFTVEELPWNASSHENINRDMMHLLDSFILMIPVSSTEKENLNDIIFFYFNKNLSNLMMTSDITVSVQQKDLVAKAYKNAVLAMVAVVKEDREVWDDFAPSFKNNSQTIEKLRTELHQMRKMYQERLIASCRFYLANLSVQYGRNYEFTRDAINLIKTYEGDYFRLENAIKSGVRIANNLHLHDSNEVINIGESYLNFNTSKRIEDINDVHLQSDLEKPFNYLNNLEEICLRLQAASRPVTGKNVAEMMDPPVKPPSITMYLNSNQDKILRLFSFYAEKWKILRTGFKPTFNLIENARNRPHRM